MICSLVFQLQFLHRGASQSKQFWTSERLFTLFPVAQKQQIIALSCRSECRVNSLKKNKKKNK